MKRFATLTTAFLFLASSSAFAQDENATFHLPSGYDRASGIETTGTPADRKVIPLLQGDILQALDEAFDDITTLPGDG